MAESQPLLHPVVEQAIRIAAVAHREQTRKGSDIPYIAHPGAVALILLRAGFGDEHLLAAAWLHDVVEDTSVTLDDLRDEFPAAVVELVDAMSEQKVDADGNTLPWARRKSHHLETMADRSVAAKAVMLADKLHNLSSMLVDQQRLGEALWDRFGATKHDLLSYYRNMIALTQGIPELDQLRDECECVLNTLSAD